MGSFKKNVTILLGVAAGAALTAFAISRSGQKELKRFGSRTADLKNELLSNVDKDFKKIKRFSREFI